MPRSLRQQPSDSGSEGDTCSYHAHRASPSESLPHRRRATSLSAGRHPGLHARHSYHRGRSYDNDLEDNFDDDDDYDRHSRATSRPSYERRYYYPEHDSGSDCDDVRHRRTRPRSQPRSAKTSRTSSPAGRSRSADYHHRRHRGDDDRGRRNDDKKRYYPPSASRSRTFPQDKSTQNTKRPARPRRSSSAILLGAGRTAFEAGAVAALKLRDDPGPWLGPKGAKIAAAALSAAAVDTFMEQKHPRRKGGLRHTVMRQATQLLIGNLVMKPAVEEVRGGQHGKVKVRQGVKEGVKGGVKDGVKTKVKERAKHPR